MTAQDLKNAILQLAVQGKLVPQDPNDEPAAELLKRIKVEKERLIKEGKIKKEKPLAPISDDEIPFDIPESWEWVHLNQIATSSLGKTMDKAKNSGSVCPYLCSINVYWEGISLSTLKTALLTEEEKSKYALIYGDLLICEGGEVGRSAVWESSDEMYYQNALHRVRFYDKISPYYFRFLMEYLKGAGIIDQYSKGQTIKHLVQGALYSIPMPLPPLAEQVRIVAKIEELMPLVEEYRKAEERSSTLNAEFPDKLRKSILQQAIQGKLTERDPADEPASELLKRIRAEKERLIKEGKIRKEQPFPPISEEEMPFEIPEGWSVVRIGDVGVYKKGPFGSSITKNMFIPKGPDAIKVYEQKNAIQKDHTLGEYYIKRSYFNEKLHGFEVFPGDVIVSCAGTIGETYVLPDGIEQGIINQALMRMKIVPSLNLDYFLLYFDYVLKKTAQGSSKGSAIKNIPPFDIFKKMVLPLPPLAEQQRIVDRINELLAVCDELK